MKINQSKMNQRSVSLFCLYGVALSCLLSTVAGQCFSKNDNALSESTPASVTKLLEGYTDFAMSLYKSIVLNDPSSSDNVFLSPVSIWSALTATYLGAENQTAVELAQALQLGGVDKVGVANAYRVLKIWYLLRTENSEANYTFRMANKLFFQQEEPLRPCMLKQFETEIKKVDFSKFPEQARISINSWVSQQTNGRITNLVPPGYIDPTTRMVLANAAYFKGTWENEFNPDVTHEDDFFVRPDHVTEVDMMHQEGVFRFVRSAALNCAAVELPYSGRELSMFVLLPNKESTAEDLVSKLDAKTFQSLVSSMQSNRVGVSLPKFQVEQSLELKKEIARLGVRDLFDPKRADLSGFTSKADFSVGNILHKTFVKVNEQGTEAAAATALVSFRTGTVVQPFKVNRPFVFMIRDNVLDTILFTGLVRTPDKGDSSQ